MRVPLMYLPCCPVPNCLGKQGELSENCLPNLTVRFILSPSRMSSDSAFAQVGDYLTDLRRPFNLAVLHCFMHECMDFSGLHLDIALRQAHAEVTFPGIT